MKKISIFSIFTILVLCSCENNKSIQDRAEVSKPSSTEGDTVTQKQAGVSNQSLGISFGMEVHKVRPGTFLVEAECNGPILGDTTKKVSRYLIQTMKLSFSKKDGKLIGYWYQAKTVSSYWCHHVEHHYYERVIVPGTDSILIEIDSLKGNLEEVLKRQGPPKSLEFLREAQQYAKPYTS